MDNSTERRNSDCEEIYEVEEILNHQKGSDGKLEYFVKWKGYDSSHNTWEPAANFFSKEMLKQYHSLQNGSAQHGNGRNSDDSSDSNHDNLIRGELLTDQFIDENKLEVEKVLNIYHMRDDETNLVAMVQFKEIVGTGYVRALWANEHCPQLVIEFYEQRIFWEDKTTGALVKHDYA